jgi:hypothetical protein
MANNNIQIYFIYNHISLINLYLNYNYLNEFNFKNPNVELENLKQKKPYQLDSYYSCRYEP